MFTKRDKGKDLFTVFGLLFTGYHRAVTSRNIINGFRKSGLWNCANSRINIAQVLRASFTYSSILEDYLSMVSTTRWIN